MITINFLETRLAKRYGEYDLKEGKNIVFADLIIDSVSLFQRLKKYGLVPAFGWRNDEKDKTLVLSLTSS